MCLTDPMPRSVLYGTGDPLGIALDMQQLPYGLSDGGNLVFCQIAQHPLVSVAVEDIAVRDIGPHKTHYSLPFPRLREVKVVHTKDYRGIGYAIIHQWSDQLHAASEQTDLQSLVKLSLKHIQFLGNWGVFHQKPSGLPPGPLSPGNSRYSESDPGLRRQVTYLRATTGETLTV